MRKLKTLLMIAAGSAQIASAAPEYKDLSTPWCDAEHKVIYDGKGYFAVQSPADTELELRINMDSMLSYINSNDYKSGSQLIGWDADFADYGIADNADTRQATGTRQPYLTGFWVGKVWQPALQVSYAALRQHAGVDGTVTVRVRASRQKGVEMTATDSTGAQHVLYSAPALRAARNTAVQGYYVNLNYVTAVSIHTPSSLDTSNYTPPKDFTQPFMSERSDAAGSLRRVMFMGDSITHGVNDQTWRWQLFKTLVDNGIEAEIVGPRSGYTPGYTRMTTPDAGESYGGVPFPNVHLAQSSGRTHNIISGSNAGMSGVNYGGHSTRSSAATYNCNTWCSLMGTNDLLSDRGYTEADFAAKMQRMLGGTVSCHQGAYTWSPGDEWGNLGRMAADVLQEADDVLYVMSVPCWGHHSNNNTPDRHLAVQAYNKLLQQWVQAYAAKHAKLLRFVDVNVGMVDPAHAVPFSWPDSMSNRPGVDGLHPNAQGSLIMAGCLARAMGLAGRTAGLPRAAASAAWQGAAEATLAPQAATSYAQAAFTPQGGYSVECLAAFGDAAAHGWQPASQALCVTVGHGKEGGQLRVSEGSILWGNVALYCGDQSAPQQPLRIVWHPGQPAHNVQRGYYVWLGDMLIGQGLQPQPGVECHGIRLESQGGAGQVKALRWVNRAFAPASAGKMVPEHAYSAELGE